MYIKKRNLIEEILEVRNKRIKTRQLIAEIIETNLEDIRTHMEKDFEIKFSTDITLDLEISHLLRTEPYIFRVIENESGDFEIIILYQGKTEKINIVNTDSDEQNIIDVTEESLKRFLERFLL